MSKLKLGLIISAMIAIGIGVIVMASHFIKPPTPVVVTENPYVKRINEEIDRLHFESWSQFKEDYNRIKYYIDDDFENSHYNERNSNRNKEQANQFYQTLFTHYSDLFIERAFTIFNGSIWAAQDLNIVWNEKNVLLKSPLLDKGTPIYNKLEEIDQIQKKYYEALKFLNDSKNFSYYKYPFTNVKDRINLSKDYLNGGGNISYVKNCNRIISQLKEIPGWLMDGHVRYLRNKIQSHRGKYSHYARLRDYKNNVWIPIDNEIVDFTKISYGLGSQNNEYYSLDRYWTTQLNMAKDYFD